MVRNAGIALLESSKSIVETSVIINNPTIKNAAEVADVGTRPNNGAINNERKKKKAVATDVRPVLPPAATPDALSTNEVTVLVPNTAPAVVAIASARNACLLFRGFPFASIRFAFVQTAINVPAVSKRSIKINVSTSTTITIDNTLVKSSTIYICLREGGRLSIL